MGINSSSKKKWIWESLKYIEICYKKSCHSNLNYKTLEEFNN